MLTQAEATDLYQGLAKLNAKGLRELAEQLEKAKTAGELAKIAGSTHSLSFKTMQLACDWMNAERKAA